MGIEQCKRLSLKPYHPVSDAMMSQRSQTESTHAESELVHRSRSVLYSLQVNNGFYGSADVAPMVECLIGICEVLDSITQHGTNQMWRCTQHQEGRGRESELKVIISK